MFLDEFNCGVQVGASESAPLAHKFRTKLEALNPTP